MTTATTQALPWLLMAAVIAIFFWWAIRSVDRILDELYPPSPEEITRREAERIAREATKEFKKRQRMRSGFWNVFN